MPRKKSQPTIDPTEVQNQLEPGRKNDETAFAVADPTSNVGVQPDSLLTPGQAAITAPLPPVRDLLTPETDEPDEDDPFLVSYSAPTWLQSNLSLHRVGKLGEPQDPGKIYEGIQFLPRNVDLKTITNLQRSGILTVEKLSDWLSLSMIRKVQSLEKGFTIDFASYIVERELIEPDLSEFIRKAVRQYNGIEL